MARADITVLGGGIFGLACAWELTRRGAKVRLIERHSIGAGASGGLVGALSPHTPEQWNPKKQFQLDSLLMAPAFWADVETASGLASGYARSGRLQPLGDGALLARAQTRAHSATQLWQGAATWAIEPVTDADWQPQSPTGLMVRDTLSARLHPRLATAALVTALRNRGAVIETGVVVETGEAPAPGETVLHATGVAGLETLSQALGRPVGGGQKGQALSLRFDAPAGAPQIYADGLHIVPHCDGTVAIGSTSERDYTDPRSTDAQLDALHRRAIAALPCLAAAPVAERWAGLRPRSRSRAPILGAWPDRPGHFIANGGFKIGFGMAPGIAATMADLILGGQDRIPDGFRPDDC